mmetsp:Transcript_27604/g.60790  ORF Transcript_27604/g.60790 Transcript_27604/m.60790 type:complete len:217 (+) Transcript_27604:25-675(+)
MVTLSKYRDVFQILVLVFFKSESEALAAVDKRKSSKPANVDCNSDRGSSSNYNLRRAFLIAGVCSASPSLVLSTQAARANDDGPEIDGSSGGTHLCHPTEQQLEKLSEARAQIDMAVQASSVQAFQSATELVNDPLLDTSSLNILLGNITCESNPSLFRKFGENGVISDILQSIANMQKQLSSSNNSSSKLTTEDAMAVMGYGTNARSALDSIFPL